MDYKGVLVNVAENAVSLTLIEYLKLSGLIDSDNQLVEYAKIGAMWTLSDEVLDYYKTSRNNISQGNYFMIVDNLFFNTLLFWAIERSGVGSAIVSNIDKLPVSQPIATSVANGVLKVSAKLVQELIESRWANSPLRAITHITEYVRN